MAAFKWISQSVALFVISCALCGCVVLALGVGAAGGYAISKDEIEGFTDKDFDRVWNAGYQTLTEEGAIELENKNSGRIEALVRNSKVKFEIETISPKSIRIRIQARKAMNLFPDIKTAQSLYVKIMKKLK